jgi:hypothetical protein
MHRGRRLLSGEGLQEPCTDVESNETPSWKSRSREKFLRVPLIFFQRIFEICFLNFERRPDRLALRRHPNGRLRVRTHTHRSTPPTLPSMRVRAVLLLALVLALVAIPAARAGSVEEEIDNELMSGTRRSRFFEIPPSGTASISLCLFTLFLPFHVCLCSWSSCRRRTRVGCQQD